MIELTKIELINIDRGNDECHPTISDDEAVQNGYGIGYHIGHAIGNTVDMFGAVVGGIVGAVKDALK